MVDFWSVVQVSLCELGSNVPLWREIKGHLSGFDVILLTWHFLVEIVGVRKAEVNILQRLYILESSTYEADWTKVCGRNEVFKLESSIISIQHFEIYKFGCWVLKISSTVLMYFCVTLVETLTFLKVPHFAVHVLEKARKHVVVTKHVILVNTGPLKPFFLLDPQCIAATIFFKKTSIYTVFIRNFE